MLEGSSGVHLLGQVWDLEREGLSIQGQPCRVERQPLLRAVTLSTWGKTASVSQDCFLTWWVSEAWEGIFTVRAGPLSREMALPHSLASWAEGWELT